MQSSIRTVQKQTRMDVFVWLDYISVAQRHADFQAMAISALPIFVSHVDQFIICAPEGVHRDSGCQCGLASYSTRGWCRMEMLAKACSSGLQNLDVCTSKEGELVDISLMKTGVLS